MIVVNSTPLIALGRIGQLELLHRLFGSIAVPQAVYDEVTAGHDEAAALLRTKPDWIQIRSIRDAGAKQWFPRSLHDGEVEVMILAEELNHTGVILDDLLARKHAATLFGRERITGTLGVLILAKRQGYIETIRPLLQALQQSGIRYSDAAIAEALRQAGEEH